MFKRFSSLLLILLLFSVLAESFHHHDDGGSHADCSICVAHQQQSCAGDSGPAFEVEREIAETVYSLSIPTFVAKVSFTPANNRAPPA